MKDLLQQLLDRKEKISSQSESVQKQTRLSELDTIITMVSAKIKP